MCFRKQRLGILETQDELTSASQTTLFPVAGSFATYGTRFIDPAWGFAMGWK